MITPPNVDTFFKHVKDALPQSFLTLHHDFEKNLKVALDSAIRRMDLVTREEFEVQSAVLARTRARLEALEAQVTTLEAARLGKFDSSNEPSE